MTNKSNNSTIQSLLVISLPSLLIAISLLLLATMTFEKGMNAFEFGGAMYDKFYPIILWVYIVILPVFFYFAIKLFRKNNIPLFSIITTGKTLARDITLGILAGICSYIFMFVSIHIVAKMPLERTDSPPLIFLEIISIVLFSGFFKELYFRGIPFYLLKDKYGEWKSFLIGNIFFMILDWPNLGLSFFLGFIWYLFFRKTGSLLIPVIGHGLCNFLGILARIGAFSLIGIIPQ